MPIKTSLSLLLLAALIMDSSSRSPTNSAACSYSSLWGAAGEKWTPAGRLPDFSYAGYHAGEGAIPNAKPKWDLKRDFQAKGDGTTDDTNALLQAIDKADNGVLFIPAGTYLITKRIDITKG